MTPVRRAAAILATVAAASALAACGSDKKSDEPFREGLAEEVGGITYNVFITRQLNTAIQPDRDYAPVPEAPQGSNYYGVFLQACNHGKTTLPAASDFRVHDTSGNEFDPKPLPTSDVFAYRPRKLAAGQCIPEEGSAAANGTTGGAMLLFQLPLAAAEARPLILEITPPPGVGTRGRKLEVQLDI